jgi:tetratricopeptide (TPR) repeat protein
VIKVTVFLILSGVIFNNLAFGIDNKICSESSRKVQSLVQDADYAYNHWDFQKALEVYQKALELRPNQYSIICKLSETYIEYGLCQKQKKNGLSYFIQAEALAKKAINLRPEQAKGYLCLAYAMGSISLNGNIKQKLAISPQIPVYAKKAINLDPALDRAWYILGSWNRKIADLEGYEKSLAAMTANELLKSASTEKAVKFLTKAIKLNPYVIEYHLELGCAYEDLHMYNQAASEYKKALDLPAHCYKHKKYHRKAKEELEEIRLRSR